MTSRWYIIIGVDQPYTDELPMADDTGGSSGGDGDEDGGSVSLPLMKHANK